MGSRDLFTSPQERVTKQMLCQAGCRITADLQGLMTKAPGQEAVWCQVGTGEVHQGYRISQPCKVFRKDAHCC